MAELHRRVLRFPGGKGLGILKALICVLLVSVSLAFAASASADAPTVADIERWAGDLRSGDDSLIAEAVENLGQLNADALPAIEARLQRTSRQIVPEEDGADALRYFRHAVGSRRADDTMDIAPGIPQVVKERPSPDVGRSAERLLLLRSLERIGSVPAQRLMGDVFALTPSMWRRERRLLLERMSARLLPGLLWMRAHDEPDVRRWARAAISRLGLNDPGRAVQEEDPERLAGILEAYGATREMNAMTVIISFVGHSDERVRQAARDAMNLFGRNGIWQLREGMRNQLGQEADHEWGWQRTSSLLYEGLDAQRLGPVTERLERGIQHMEAGELAEARELFDAALIREPMHPRRSELAEHYARFAENASGPERESLLQRALWLQPDSPQADSWQRALLAVEVERNVAAGFEDVRADDVTQSEDAIASNGEATTSEATESASNGYSSTAFGLLVGLLLLGGLVWKRGWFAAKLKSLLPHMAKPKAKAKASSRSARKAQTRELLLRWKTRLGPFASKALSMAWTGSRRVARELLSLSRTLMRVVSPGSVKKNPPRPTAKKKPVAKLSSKKVRPTKSSGSTQSFEQPVTRPQEAIPLAGLLFGAIEASEDEFASGDEEGPDTVDTAFEEMPAELPGFFSDTSPGTIEAPDTLPG
ncbi:MAG: hypothetical protein AB8H86_02165 [Polyangiales bacterium]